MSAEWQPIETAPRDGRWFLAVMAGYVPAVICWSEGKWSCGDGEDASPDVWELTHWMPLPSNTPGDSPRIWR